MNGDRVHLHVAASGPGTSRAAAPASRALGRFSRRQRRRRRVVGLARLAVFLLLIFLAVWAGVRVAHAGEDAAAYTGHQYVVMSGDDLWTIAAGEYGHAVDLRAAVYAIREANALDGSVIQPGQRVTLPYLGE